MSSKSKESPPNYFSLVRLPKFQASYLKMIYKKNDLRITRGFLLSALIFSGSIAQLPAIKNETNQGRWEKAATTGPDAEVPGFLINMGPTGARGILKKDSYTVKYIFSGSPADGVLQLEDEVIGANGKLFGDHTFGGTNINYGIEGPLQDLGLAIEDSEGEDGVLTLKIKRESDTFEVDIQLEKLGRFSNSFPRDCEKTKLLRERAYKYLMENPGGIDSQARCIATLAMLSADDRKVQRAGEKMALDWNTPYGNETWAWHLGFQGIVLSEYHLLTGDRKVLSTLEKTMGLLELAQWKSPIDHVKIDKMKNPAPKTEVDRAQNLYDGGFGHAPYTVIKERGGGGYGPMQWPTCLALITWQLADECDVEFDFESPEKSYRFLDHGTTNAGKVAYGGEFTLNNGVIDPERWKRNNANKFSHKSGLAYIVHMLSEEREESKEMMDLHLSNIDAAYRDMSDGHACGLMGFTWGLAGVYASDDEKLQKKITNYYKAYFNLARCHGSDSYVVLPNRDYADGSYYRKNIRTHTTAAMAFIYSFGTPKLRVQGAKMGEQEDTSSLSSRLPVKPKPEALKHPYRTFTNKDGTKTFEGSVLIFEKNSGLIQVQLRNGQTSILEFSQISAEDQNYLRNLEL